MFATVPNVLYSKLQAIIGDECVFTDGIHLFPQLGTTESDVGFIAHIYNEPLGCLSKVEYLIFDLDHDVGGMRQT